MSTLGKMFSSRVETIGAQVAQLTGEEVLAAGQLRQGRRPSMTAMVTGAALFELVKPRRAKALPRHFVLALTPTRAVAFACIGVSEEDGENYHVVVRGKERGWWPREAVGFAGAPGGEGTLTVAGESFPVSRPNLDEDAETAALLAALGG